MVDSVSRPSPDDRVGLSRIAGTDLVLPRPFWCTPSHERTALYNTSAKFAKRFALFSLGSRPKEQLANSATTRATNSQVAFRVISLDSRTRHA